jgi:hypothetical protein
VELVAIIATLNQKNPFISLSEIAQPKTKDQQKVIHRKTNPPTMSAFLVVLELDSKITAGCVSNNIVTKIRMTSMMNATMISIGIILS